MHGRRFADRYELRHLLGRGGMAEVWQARDLRMDRDVAVKLLDRAAVTDPAAIERFRREALAVARIAHPNIVSAYDFGPDGDRPFLVMELVPGETLDARLARGPLPAPQAVDVAAQTCAALEAAHRAGVIHRDVKPGNIIITPDGTVKVLDFGIARLQDAAGSLTRTATVVGSSHYMSPEQASGDTTSERTDLYAVGCLLYAMVTGQPPYQGENPMGVLYQHLHSPPPQLTGVPPAVANLVGELLVKDPADRPESAALVRARLTQLAIDPGLTAALPTTAVRSAAPAAATSAAGVLAGSEGAPGRPAAGRAAVPVPAPSMTQTMPAASWEQSRPGRRWLVPAAVAVVVGVIVLAVVVLALWPDPKRTASPPPTVPSSAAPSPTPTPSATDPAGRLAEVRAVLAEQVSAGEVDSEAAGKINERLDKIAEDIRKGELDQAANHVAELRNKLGELDGVSETAREQLNAALDRLANVLPEPGGGDKPGKGRGNGKGNKDD